MEGNGHLDLQPAAPLRPKPRVRGPSHCHVQVARAAAGPAGSLSSHRDLAAVGSARGNIDLHLLGSWHRADAAPSLVSVHGLEGQGPPSALVDLFEGDL